MCSGAIITFYEALGIMTKGLTAWKFFLKKFPTANSQTACSIVQAISSLNTLRGMYWAACAKKFSDHYERDLHIEGMSNSRWAVNQMLYEFFGVDRSLGTKDEHFDPVELSDSLGYNPNVIKMFKKRDRDLK